MRRMGWVWKNACCILWQWNLLAAAWCSEQLQLLQYQNQITKHKEGDPSFHGCNHKHIKLNAHKKGYLTTKRKTNKSYCIVDPLLLEEPKSTLPVFEYCCHAAHNTAALFQLETAALVLPAPLGALSLFLIPHCQYRVKSSEEEKRL